MPYQLTIVLIFLGFGVLEAARQGLIGGLFKKETEKPSDIKVELIGGLIVSAVTQPAILLGAAALSMALIPAHEGALAGLPFWAGFLLLVLFDDMMQYWWHRLSHSLPWLYNLHRSHHNAGYMSVRIVYRNNVFYYLFMPSLWLSGVLIYLGLGEVYAVYAVVKLAIIMGAHSSERWDQPLYKIKALDKVMWVVERLISTPTTHSAHHGQHISDGKTHYKGNFGNMLFLWDVLFGTAKITRQLPDSFGVENLPDVTTAEQLVWPLVRSDRTKAVAKASDGTPVTVAAE